MSSPHCSSLNDKKKVFFFFVRNCGHQCLDLTWTQNHISLPNNSNGHLWPVLFSTRWTYLSLYIYSSIRKKQTNCNNKGINIWFPNDNFLSLPIPTYHPHMQGLKSALQISFLLTLLLVFIFLLKKWIQIICHQCSRGLNSSSEFNILCFEKNILYAFFAY